MILCPTETVMAATIAKHSSLLPGEFVALACACRWILSPYGFKFLKVNVQRV